MLSGSVSRSRYIFRNQGVDPDPRPCFVDNPVEVDVDTYLVNHCPDIVWTIN